MYWFESNLLARCSEPRKSLRVNSLIENADNDGTQNFWYRGQIDTNRYIVKKFFPITEVMNSGNCN